MYIDGISISKIKEELLQRLKNKKVNKVTQNSDLSLTIHFGKTQLFFSCNPTLPICYIKEEVESNIEGKTNLILNLRKHLQSSMLLDIEQIGFDRILVFKFSKLTELGEIKEFKIYFEMMGKHSNLFLTTSEDVILELLKRFSLEESKLRPLFPGMRYEQPVLEKKILPQELSAEKFEEFKEKGELLQKVEGMGKLLAQNLKSYEELQEVLVAPMTPKIFYRDKKILLAEVLNIVPTNYDEVKEFATYEEFINYYITTQQLSASYQTLKSKLMAGVVKEIKKNTKILKSIEREQEEKKDYERYKEIGDILASSLYTLKRGMKSCNLYDFYRNEMVDIELDPLLTPQSNLEKYYKRYNKMKRGLEMGAVRGKQITEELEYLERVQDFIERAKSYEDLKGIEGELISGKYIKIPKDNKKRKHSVKEIKYGVIEQEGMRILYGRNNLENDNLTFKVAGREEYWFHVKDVPGSHVILKVDGEPTEEQILEAAKVAVKFSKANEGDKVQVDYVKRKNINKPKGAKPGFVIYNGESTILLKK
jgi:predicted ribosome quality control (RQC) complex YloA/Tae2 family protein